MAWNVLPDPAILVKAQFINFNAVECPIPSHNQSYIVKVTNDGLEFSAGLMFIPFDSRCNDCSTNTTTCVKKVCTMCLKYIQVCVYIYIYIKFKKST